MQNYSNWLRMKMITSIRYSYFSKKGINVFHQYSELIFFYKSDGYRKQYYYVSFPVIQY